RRQLAPQSVRLDAPELFTRPFDPASMRRRRAKPVQPWLSRFAIREKRIEVRAHLLEYLFACRIERLPFADHLCHILGKIVREVARFFIGVLSSSEWRVHGCARTPDFVRFADVIARVAQQMWKARD